MPTALRASPRPAIATRPLSRREAIAIRIKENNAKLKTAKADLAAHKKIMQQSRYTAESYKVALVKLNKLEARVEKLQKEHTQLARLTRL